ncbi:hypothetical protein J3B02_004202, partial [Coemansia erecta]
MVPLPVANELGQIVAPPSALTADENWIIRFGRDVVVKRAAHAWITGSSVDSSQKAGCK